MSDQKRSALDNDVTLRVCGEFVLSFASVLLANGQSTDRVTIEVSKLADSFDVQTRLILHWDEVQIEISDRQTTMFLSVASRPAAISMNRVTTAMAIIAAFRENRLAFGAARTAMIGAAHLPPASLWSFTLAGAGGAVAVAILSGLQDWTALFLIFVSGGTGALLRRYCAGWSSNLFLQPFVAALLAGIIPVIGAQYDPGPEWFLVAVSPCLILVPGPHFLNGALDLISGHIQLGIARLVYAILVVLTISGGLLLGLAAVGVSLPVDGSVGTISLWQDSLAAGIAIAAYSTFFAMPQRMLAWPIAIGMFAHALKWIALRALGLNGVAGVFWAYAVVGVLITVVARRTHMPFAAIGFASVVSMMPGGLMFRTVSGVLQIDGIHPSAALIGQTVFNGTTAVATIVAISVGLIMPRLIIDGFWKATPHGKRIVNRPSAQLTLKSFATDHQIQPREIDRGH